MTRDSRVSTLVIQTAFLGDVVLTTPLLAALAARDGAVDVVTTPSAAALLRGHPAVHRVVTYDKRAADRGLGGLRRTAAQLREASYSRAYLPHRSWRSAALALLARIPHRIGFADSPAAVTYTQRVPRERGVHETVRLARLASGPGEPLEHGAERRVSLGLEEAHRAAADAWLHEAGITGEFAVVAPGSVWGTKRWPYYPALAREVPLPVVVVGGPDEAHLAQAIAAVAPDRVHSAAGRLALSESAALIERAAVIITNDSAPLHLAAAVGTPTVAIFGPTVPEFGFGPTGPRDRVVGVAGLACRPCSTHGPQVCPLGHHRCMRDLDVATVVAAVRSIILGEDRSALRARD